MDLFLAIFIIVGAAMVSMLPLIIGVILLVYYGIESGHTKKKHIPALIIGIVLILAELPIAALQPIDKIYHQTTNSIGDYRYQMAYGFFEEYVETDEIIEPEMYRDRLEGFDFHGVHYSLVEGMNVLNHDKNRKEAIANLSSCDFTVFRYENESGCDLLCINKEVFCPDEQRNDLDEYYRNQKFSYSYKHVDSADYQVRDCRITDDVYFSLFDFDPSVVTVYPGEFDYLSDDRGSTKLIDFCLVQNCGNGQFQREICLDIESDGAVFVCKRKTYGLDSVAGTTYQITDPSIRQFFVDLVVEKQKDLLDYIY